MRLLWIQPGAIGDFIVAMPCMAWVKETLKPEWFEVWAEARNVPLVLAPGYANHAIALADTGIERYPVPEAFFERLRDFDLVLSCWGAIAADLTRRHPNAYFLKSLPPDGNVHVQDFKKSQLENLLGCMADFQPYPKIHWTPQDLCSAKEFLVSDQGRPIAVIHPGASSGEKMWPAANYAALAVRLTEERQMRVLLAEGPLDRYAAHEVRRLAAAGPGRFDLQRLQIDNLRELSAVLSLCNLYVGNDSGITHLASASGTQVVAIFTVTNPRVWAPRGPKVQVCVNPTVDEVWEKLVSPQNS